MSIQASDTSSSRPIEADPLASLDARVRGEVSTPPKARPASLGGHVLLGRELADPLGIAASAVSRTSGHIAFFANRGFDVLTYKTVRSREWAPHPAPLWIYLDDLDEPLVSGDIRGLTVHGSPGSCPEDPTSYSTANSYGVPSEPPERWQEGLAEAIGAVRDGQVLLASVQGSSEIFRTPDALVGDFVEVARLAEETDVPAIELNLSCPNTVDERVEAVFPPICEDRFLSERIVRTVREALGEHTRLVAKLSYLPHLELEGLVRAIAPHVDAISGINTLQAEVRDPDGEPVFRGTRQDPDLPRAQAGVSGVALRTLAREFVATVAATRTGSALDFEIIGIGGVMVPEDARALLQLGASAVQMATTAARDPDFAVKALPLLGGAADVTDRLARS